MNHRAAGGPIHPPHRPLGR